MIGRIRVAFEEGANDRIRFNVDGFLLTAHKTAEKCKNGHVFFVGHRIV